MATTDPSGPEQVSMASAADTSQLVSDRAHRLRWWALAVLNGGLLVITLDTTILNVAVPALVKSLGASMGDLQWIIDGYTLVFACLLLTAGALGDRFGRKGALQGGLVVFALASLASSLSTSTGQLVIARGFMGLGAAFIMPSTLSLLTNLFRDPRERARAIGLWAAPRRRPCDPPDVEGTACAAPRSRRCRPLDDRSRHAAVGHHQPADRRVR